MTADALAVSRESGAALVDTGGRFLVSDQMAARAKELGMQAGGLYFRGRTGALGEVSSHAATAILGIFPHWVIDLTWRESAALPAATAVTAYSTACAEWGTAYLSGLPGMDRLADLAERVADAADTSALPLFAAWQTQPRPAADGPRAAAISDLSSRREAAEEDTHVAFADQLGVLALGEQRELAAPIDRANVASRPPGTPMGGGRMTRTSSGGPSD